MLNITNYQGNVNKTAVKCDLILTRMATIKKQKRTRVGRNVEKLEPLYIVGGNLNGVAAIENNREVPPKF